MRRSPLAVLLLLCTCFPPAVDYTGKTCSGSCPESGWVCVAGACQREGGSGGGSAGGGATGGGSSGGGPHGKGQGATEPLHVAFFRGVDNAEAIRDLVREGVRRQKDSGLGDPDDHQAHSVHESHADTNSAALELLREARKLRAAFEA